LRISRFVLGAVALAGLLLIAGCAGSGDGGDASTTTTTAVVQPIADGEWFALVTVGADESGAATLGVDLAEMLSGEEARLAAIEDGVISEDEDLPNDFYIDNDDTVLELVHLADDARFVLISGTDIDERVAVDADTLVALWEGTYEGDPIYGVAPGLPVAMNITITDGRISQAEAVYLP
jgi:hypothetical protein